jgi:hypothetical protein
MKILVFLFLFTFSVFAEEQDNLAFTSDQDNLEKLLSKYDSQINDINQKFTDFNENLRYNINNYNSIFSHWLNIQQILIGLLSGLSLLLPLLTYLFGYKPAKDAEKRLEILEAKFETIVKERLEKYIIDKEIDDMKMAIKNLSSKNSELETQAVNYISYNPNVQVDDIERKNIYDMLVDDNFSEQLKLPLQLVLSNKKSIWADLYFDLIMTKEEYFKKYYFYVSKYLLLNGLNHKKEKIINFLKKTDDKYSLLIFYIIHTSLTFSDSLLREIINDKDLLSIYSKEELINLHNHIKNTYNKQQSWTEDSELYRIIINK